MGEQHCIQPSATYESMLWYRRAILSVSCLGILWSIVIIIKKRQYVFMTLKLLLFVQIFYFIALFSVLPHNSDTTSCTQLKTENESSRGSLARILNQIIVSKMTNTQRFLCGLQGFINLSAYNISYFFGVLLTLNIRKVLDNTHKKFIRQNLVLMIAVILLILVVYSIPLILIFVDEIPYSYGPAGFYLFENWFDVGGEQNNFMIYFCGLCTRTESTVAIILINCQMFLIPLTMFTLHGYLLFINHKSTLVIKSLQDINPKQWFIIRTGKISFVLFVVQALNFCKSLVISIDQDNDVVQFIFVWVNILFDLFPLVIVLFYYFGYYAEANIYNNHNRIRQTDSTSIVTNQQLLSR